MRALVTGAGGFAGKYLVRALRERGHDVISAGRADDRCDVVLDLSDTGSIRNALDASRPDAVFHLAAQTFLPEAAQHPIETYETNILGTARLLGALKQRTRFLFTSSAQVYGAGPRDSRALTEDLPLRPVEPYAASKAAAEDVCLAAHHTLGQDCVVARAFNHIGPGQDARFAVASFAHQLARIAAGAQPPRIDVGNLEAERDFLDVRDVVQAYALLAERGKGGDAYNVCSGVPRKIKELLRILIVQAGVAVEVREDPQRMRAADIPRFYGDNSKLRALGWQPQISLDESLRDVYDAARAVTQAGAPT
ncbi:MAG: GDP-mannose 4,6-dehydratase [Candidatus Eremiobacteraeota bacterium]|nr:GDP-mannose 4,6-dehydratase [Candidatus Eremiobacteraeota bacterium]